MTCCECDYGVHKEWHFLSYGQDVRSEDLTQSCANDEVANVRDEVVEENKVLRGVLDAGSGAGEDQG